MSLTFQSAHAIPRPPMLERRNVAAILRELRASA